MAKQPSASTRPLVCGPDAVDAPFPCYLSGKVEHGFGRGSKQLNCATANLNPTVMDCNANDQAHRLHGTGVFYGWAQVRVHEKDMYRSNDSKVHPMVMSLGWNPHFKNEKRTIEVHIMHDFQHDFYGEEMRVIVLGYIRPELEFNGLGT